MAYWKNRPMSEDKQKEIVEKKEKLRKLSKMVSEMPEAERLERFGGNVLGCAGTAFSAFNTCFLIAQNPKCSLVGGFKQWQAAGRSVRKGETAMAIWIPAPYGSKEAEAIPAGDATENKGGKRFILRNCMFDISQTEPIDAAETSQENLTAMPSMALACV